MKTLLRINMFTVPPAILLLTIPDIPFWLQCLLIAIIFAAVGAFQARFFYLLVYDPDRLRS